MSEQSGSQLLQALSDGVGAEVVLALCSVTCGLLVPSRMNSQLLQVQPAIFPEFG